MKKNQSPSGLGFLMVILTVVVLATANTFAIRSNMTEFYGTVSVACSAPYSSADAETLAFSEGAYIYGLGVLDSSYVQNTAK